MLALLLAGVLAVTGASVLTVAAFAGQRQPPAQPAATRMGTVACGDVGSLLDQVPAAAQPAVDRDLADLDVQVADAYRSLMAPGAGGGEQRVMDALVAKRTTTLRNLKASAGPDAGLPGDLTGLASCGIRRDLVVDASARDYAPDAQAGSSGSSGPSGPAALSKGSGNRGAASDAASSTSAPSPRTSPSPPAPGRPPAPSPRSAAATRTATSTPTT
ncbi:hypothetical protein GCM10025734_11930 [Kitasatospora paranensis]